MSEVIEAYRNDNKGVIIYQADVMDGLKALPDESIHLAVTSPPYWALRDYKTGEWSGGLNECDHTRPVYDTSGNTLGNGAKGLPITNSFYKGQVRQYGNVCKKCGAVRQDKQLGQEDTPEEFVSNLVNVFRELGRVLRNDGTLWINIGDSYHKGQLACVPWMLAIAMKDDGWLLRQDNIWAKEAPMPEPTENRCTKSHEYVFHFAKAEEYYFDSHAIKTPSKDPGAKSISKEGGKSGSYGQAVGAGKKPSGNAVPGKAITTGLTSNMRDVWWINSGKGYPGSHHAVFPPSLPEICILAGTSAYGCCSVCKASWKRVIKEVGMQQDGNGRDVKNRKPGSYYRHGEDKETGFGGNDGAWKIKDSIGWLPNCICSNEKVVPCAVLDPFMGSGTTAAVAIEHNRHCIGIELNEDTIKHTTIPRIEEAVRMGTAKVSQVLHPSLYVKPCPLKPKKI